MKRVKRFYEGGVGYEENPKPGSQFKTISEKRTKKEESKKSSPRKISVEEFIEEYEEAPASGRMKQEARYSADRESGAEPIYPEALMLAGRAAGAIKDAQIPLRVKQMIRRAKTARANEAERAADKAGEAARKGVSRRDTPSFSERYRAQKQAEEDRKALREGREPRGLPDWRGFTDRPGPGQSYFNNEVFRKGGKVKAKAKVRGYGIAQKGRGRGRFVK